MREVEFTIGEMLGIALTLVVTGIGVAYGLQIMADVRDDLGEDACNSTHATFNTTAQQCQNSTGGGGFKPATAEFNATEDGIEGVAKLPEKLPTIATVIVAAIIIGILITYLWGRFAR